MITLTGFTGQNWLITPAAPPVGQAQTTGVLDPHLTTGSTTVPVVADHLHAAIPVQKLLLVLSGVAKAEFQPNSTGQWSRETLQFIPDMEGPLNFAISHFSIQKPPASSSYGLRFSLEQWAPFASPNSILNQDQSINSGFAVNVWRPAPFSPLPGAPAASRIDVLTHLPLTNIFNGIKVDVAVRDREARTLLIGYNITLLGKIVFVPNVIT
jgi:hypothetical protein